MKILQILVLMLGLFIITNAQKSTLTGSVYDANGAVIIDAEVTAINKKGEKIIAKTSENGFYVLELPYNPYNPSSSGNNGFKIAEYDIIVESEYFERFVLKNFKFVPSYKGKMFLDFALNIKENDNCGAGGCVQSEPQVIESPNLEITNTITEKPLEKTPKK